MKKLLLAFVIASAGSLFAADISIGIQIGAPPPVRVMAVRPECPGPEFVWITGYWYPVGHHYRWHDGYWTRPPYEGALWIAPRHDGGRYFEGYWQGGHGFVAHDHHWDRGHDRDFRRDWRDHDHDGDHDRDHDRDDDHDHGHGRGRGHDRD
jgi:hypothetical protein